MTSSSSHNDLSRRQLLRRGGTLLAAFSAASILDTSVVEAKAKRPPVLGQVSSVRLWSRRPTTKGGGGARVIYDGETLAVLNLGGLGRLRGTALPNALGHCVLAGHRTSHGGPLRRTHTLVVGDTITVVGSGLTKTYRLVEPQTIVDAADRKTVVHWGDPSMSSLTLVACSKRNHLPTDVRFRLISRFVEVPAQ